MFPQREMNPWLVRLTNWQTLLEIDDTDSVKLLVYGTEIKELDPVEGWWINHI